MVILKANFSKKNSMSCHFVNHFFNSALRVQHFPVIWKKAEVITILKPGKDPKIPQNRLLSLPSVLPSVLWGRYTRESN